VKETLARIRVWWKRPITRRDRVRSAGIGAMAGIWIGLLAFILSDGGPASLTELGIWVLFGAISCAGLAALFPRVLGIVLFPLSIFGIGN
jgi:hypothetical protein